LNTFKQIKSLSKDSLLYGFSGAVGKFVGLFTAPILTRIFTPADYGIISLMQTMVGFLVMIAGFNIVSGVFRYYYEYDDKDKRRQVLSTGLLFIIICAVLFSVLTNLMAPTISGLLNIRQSNIIDTSSYDIIKYIKILSIGMFFELISINYQYVLRMTRQPHKYLLMTLTKVVVNVISIITLVVIYEFGIEGAIWSGVIANISIVIAGVYLTRKNYTVSFSTSMLWLFLSYSLPQFPAVIINWMLEQSNRFFINYYSSLENQGYYSIGLKVASIFLLFTFAFRLAWDPYALSIMKNKDAKQVYSKFYSIYFALIGSVAIFISLMAKPVLMVLTPENYHVAFSIVFILVWGFLIQGSNSIIAIGIAISKKTIFISYAQIMAFVINLLLNIILIPRYGAWGAAISLLGGVLTQSLAYYYFASKVYPVKYEYFKNQLVFTGLFFCIAAFTYFIRDFGIVQSLILALVAFTACLSIIWVFIIRQSDRLKIVYYIKQLLLLSQ